MHAFDVQLFKRRIVLLMAGLCQRGIHTCLLLQWDHKLCSFWRSCTTLWQSPCQRAVPGTMACKTRWNSCLAQSRREERGQGTSSRRTNQIDTLQVWNFYHQVRFSTTMTCANMSIHLWVSEGKYFAGHLVCITHHVFLLAWDHHVYPKCFQHPFFSVLGPSSQSLDLKVWEESYRYRLLIRPRSQHSKCSQCIRHKLILQKLRRNVPGRRAQMMLYQAHLDKQYHDRTIYWRNRSRSRDKSLDDGSRTLCVTMDSIDHSKFQGLLHLHPSYPWGNVHHPARLRIPPVCVRASNSTRFQLEHRHPVPRSELYLWALPWLGAEIEPCEATRWQLLKGVKA